MTRDAGDSGILLELEAVINPTVNARAIAIARAVRDRRLPGIRDVIPTYRSVAVHFDPLISDVDVLRDALREAASAPPLSAGGSLIEVPVAYGGANGPDLEDVAAFAKLPAKTVVDRHCGCRYRVFMLGFLPGFAYMGVVDESIAAPRKATPRTRIPSGSVGIAGRQTGVYPRESPGGWQLIGRTSLHVFDPTRDPASLFAPGDRVRFVETAGIGIRDPGFRLQVRRLRAPNPEPRTPNPGRLPFSSQGCLQPSRMAVDGATRIADTSFRGDGWPGASLRQRTRRQRSRRGDARSHTARSGTAV